MNCFFTVETFIQTFRPQTFISVYTIIIRPLHVDVVAVINEWMTSQADHNNHINMQWAYYTCVNTDESLWPKRLNKMFNGERTFHIHSPEGLTRITSCNYIVNSCNYSRPCGNPYCNKTLIVIIITIRVATWPTCILRISTQLKLRNIYNLSSSDDLY